MSGEIWNTPIVVGTDAVPTTFFENQRQNIVVLGKGGGKATLDVAVAASTLTLPNQTDDFFRVTCTGGETVSYISTTGRQYGNKIKLVCSGSGFQVLSDQTNPPSGYARVHFVVHAVAVSSPSIYDKTIYEFTLYNDGTNDIWLCTI